MRQRTSYTSRYDRYSSNVLFIVLLAVAGKQQMLGVTMRQRTSYMSRFDAAADCYIVAVAGE
jgi:hypothetical protein